MNGDKTLLRVTLFGGVCTFVFGMSIALSPHQFPSGYYVAQTATYTATEDSSAYTNTTSIDTTTDTATTDATTSYDDTTDGTGTADTTSIDTTTDTATTDTTTRTEETTVTDTTTDTGTTDTTTTETNTVIAPPPAYLSCPLVRKEGRVIIDLTKGGTVDARTLMLVSHLDAKRASRAWIAPQPIPAGRYAVYLAGFDDHRMDTVTEYREEWFVTLFGGDGTRLYTSPKSRDLKDTEHQAMERVATDATVSAPVYKAMFRHAAYPDTVPNSIAPLCVALDYMGPLETATSDTSETQTVTNDSETHETTDTATETDTSTKTDASATEPDLSGTRPLCPIPVRAGRVIVDFTHGGTVLLRDLTVVSAGTKVEATYGPRAVSLGKGIYDVRIASHRVAPIGKGEVWRAMLFGSNGTIVAHTPASRDIPAWETVFVSRVAEAFSVDTDVVRVAGMHALHPSTEGTPVGVLCVAFDRVGEVSTENTYEEGVANPPPSTLNEDLYREPTPQGTPAPSVQTGHTNPDTTMKANVSPQVKNILPPTLAPTTATRESPVSSTDEPALPPFVREARETIRREYGDELFTVLARESQRDRIRVARTLLERHDSVASATTSPPLDLTRTLATGTLSDTVPQDGRERVVQATRERGGLAVLRDSDGDGVSDYDELYIYGTDPHSAHTSGSVFSDGERILLGLNVHTDDMVAVPVESAREVKIEIDTRFTVSEIVSVPLVEDEGRGGSGVRVVGTAEPFLFVTLYVYSTPIVVTVRADVNGRFEYTFDEQLADGSHEVYVTKVDTTGRILAKSASVPFVKTAEAISFTPPSTPESPVESGSRTALTLLFISLMLGALIVVVGIGVWKSEHPPAPPVA